MSVYKDGNKFPISYSDSPAGDAHDIPTKIPQSRAAKALWEGACLDEACDVDGRAEEYEKMWKEGQKV